MNIFTEFISVLLGTDEKESKEIAQTWLPRLSRAAWHLLRLTLVIIFIHCLYNYPSAGVTFIILGWFMIESEKRIDKLEKKLEIERRLNRDSYSTKRYSGRPDHGETD